MRVQRTLAGHKQLHWVGTALDDVRAFPHAARQLVGRQLRRVQAGLMPDAFKPMPEVGPGVQEVIIDTGDAFRVFYVAKFIEGIYVLHAFQKKTQKTTLADIARGQTRYRAVVARRLNAASSSRTGR